jgi:hypothetical protein
LRPRPPYRLKSRADVKHVGLLSHARWCHPRASRRRRRGSAVFKCTSNPCANTPTGEDPDVIALREGKAIEAALRRDPNDKMRWSSLILFSSSTDAQALSMPIVMAAMFNVALNPKKGWLIFSTPQGSQGFKIASAAGSTGDLCPNYQIRVLQGGPGYAVIKKTCPRFEYRAGRFYRGTDYYLYDAKSNTMREIWAASTQLDTSTPFPSAKPEVAVKIMEGGYRFDWVGMLPSDNPASLMKIHNLYKSERDKKAGYMLACYDMTYPAQPLKGNEMCDGGELERVAR